MDSASVTALVLGLFLPGAQGFPLPPDADLLETGICDSLGLVRLAAELERAVPGLRIHDADVTPDNLGSIERIVHFLSQVR